MEVQIRSADPTDIPDIRSVAEAAWHEAHAPIVGTDTVEAFLAEYYTVDAFADRLIREDVVLDVAVADDTVRGYVMAIRDDEDSTLYHLAHIYIDPDDWGNGIGQSLLEHLEWKLADRGVNRVELGVMADNDRAIEFYERAGYERVAEGYDDRIETANYTYRKPL